MLRSKIISTGSYLPTKILNNQQLSKMVDTSDEWITERTGIKERRIADSSISTSDIALEASKKAIKDAGIKASEISMIIVGTITGDMPMPATACLLQKKLGIKDIPAFDINAACSGFLYGISIADGFIKSKSCKYILVVGAEMLSRFTDWKDRTTCVIFGDGAGAALLTGHNGKDGILSTHIHADGNFSDLIKIPAGGSQKPTSELTVRERMHFIKMKGNETFKIAVKTLGSLVEDTLKHNGITAQQLSLLIPHQANKRIISAVAERLGISEDKIMMNIEKYGNTSAASVPIALDEAVRSGRIKPKDYILLEAFGAGLTWASALIRW
ncbi:MAG: ketoacyl-ACP synthase III [Thermodesulfovibrionales bacterium]|nr:ketoacyl-ACP synthase III [Thermodesulfovibrionales bacterium]